MPRASDLHLTSSQSRSMKNKKKNEKINLPMIRDGSGIILKGTAVLELTNRIREKYAQLKGLQCP